ncbi:hypothetical protein ACMD2_24296 [Ananas comosus]|uniref:Uncharacterized protein n=1 Tax=Ananas comosus TaxID=4615 RepID=A0A199W121_ANACO|nr:hypothetical protein ACMD2_24296 [Ananas comosus]
MRPLCVHAFASRVATWTLRLHPSDVGKC